MIATRELGLFSRIHRASRTVNDDALAAARVCQMILLLRRLDAEVLVYAR